MPWTDKQIPGVPRHWQEYILCILYHLGLPIMPLGLEYILAGKITVEAATLVASMYAVATSCSSRNLLTFGLGIIVGLIFANLFGIISGGVAKVSIPIEFPIVSILILFFAHAVERFNRHVREGENFWKFR